MEKIKSKNTRVGDTMSRGVKISRYFPALAATLLLLVLLAAGCGKIPAQEPGSPAGESIPVLTVGTTMPVNGIDIDDYYFGILRAIFTHKGLVSLDKDGAFQEELAGKWETPDSRVWTFHLREGMYWHDGVPVTAHDVEFSFAYLLEHIPVYTQHWGMIEAVTVPDDHTLVITLEKPNSRFLVNLLVLRTLPAHIFVDIDDPQSFQEKEATLGCGPYIFDSFDAAAGLLVFKANQDYLDGAPAVPEVHIRLFKNSDTLYMALQRGEVDTVYFYGAGTEHFYVPRLMQSGNIDFLFIPNTGVPNSIMFNVTQAPVDQPRFREAVSYAVDYEEIQRIFTAGYGEIPRAGFVPEGSWGYVETRLLSMDREKAEQILDELGYLDLTGDGFRQYPDGSPLVVELLLRSDMAESIRLGETLATHLQTVGLKLSLKTVDQTLFQTIAYQEKKHTAFISRTTAWGMMMWGGLGSGYFDSRNIAWTQVADPAFHELVDRILVTVKEEELVALAASLQEYYARELPAIPLYWNTFIQPYNKRWEGWVTNPMYGILNSESWFTLQFKGNNVPD